MPTTYCCPNCKQALAVLEMHINTNIVCPTCGQWFFAASAPANVPPIQKQPAPSTLFPPNVTTGTASSKPFRRVTESTRFLYGICATAGFLIAGGIGYLMLQDSEAESDLPGKATTTIDDPLPSTPPALPDAKKILEDEIAASKSEESELNSELKNLTGELETLRADTQSRKNEAEAMNRERSVLVGESK